MDARPKISLITITKNEEELIRQCLNSAWFCEEKIVVDSFSTDRTVEIARECGAQVFQHEFTNYVVQKQMALDHATGEWVLLMDADEQATHDLGAEILRETGSASPAEGYRIQRMLYHLGGYDLRGIEPDTPVRLFRRERGRIGGRDPHDKIVVDGKVTKLRGLILHFSYRAAAEHEPTRFTAFKMVVNPVARFFVFYIVRRGFLDGIRGFYAAATSAFYVFLKYAKLYERRLKTQRPR